MKLVAKIIGILLSLLLWYLQEMPTESEIWYKQVLINYKTCVAILGVVIVIGVILSDYIIDYFKKRNSIKKWADSFLQHIIIEHLDGRDYQTRISILHPQKGYKIIVPYLIIYPIKALFKREYRVNHKAYWKNIPYKIFDDYLTIYARYGHSDNFYSYTHFYLTARNAPSNGVADKCYKEEKEQEVCTNNITNMTFPQKYDEAKHNDKIKKYMEDSFIDGKYYSTMLLMNTCANNLYAVPIFNKNQRIWGVMMIDNDSSRQISYKQVLDRYIASYQKIFSYTLEILK